MDIESFFPKYPNIHKIKDNAIINPYDDESFNDVIVNKREFNELKLAKEEALPEPGKAFNHQKIISRFLSSKTPYDELLLFHEMGTGKTCTAINVIENIRYLKPQSYHGALIFTRSVSLGKNFIHELFFKCTDGRYIPEHYERLSDFERIRRMGKIFSKYYTFLTFEVFAKALKKMSDNDIMAKYNNIIIVIDEVHNLRLKENDDDDEDLDIYNEFFRFLHVIKNRKVLLLSGTPMKDSPAEIASVMNLILPLHMQFAATTFMKDYFTPDNTIKPSMVPDLASRISGRVSYLKSMTSAVQKVFKGESMGLKHFKVVALKMHEFQSQYYEKAYRRDKKEKGVFNNSRQACLFVFPDGTYGVDGFTQNRYVLHRKHGLRIKSKKRTVEKTIYFLGPELVTAINHDIRNIYKYSCKFGYTVETVSREDGKMFIYCEYVNGSGLILLSLILDHFGFVKATGEEKTKGKRYALISNQTTTPVEIQRLIARYNKPDNVDGEYIKVILGSRVIAEGITLKDVIHEFILTPHWNYSETSQVISRGWRVGSHLNLINRGDTPVVTIHQEAAIPNGTKVPSIDLEMYKISENKDVAIKQVEYVIKQTSFDCPLTIRRNKVEGMDGMRECDYMSCDYTCAGAIKGPIDDITYNLYYSTSDEIRHRLNEYFKTNFSIQIHQLYAMFANRDRFQINKALNELINNDIQFKNIYGFDCYLRERDDTIYITVDPGKIDEYLSEYYTKNILLKRDVDYEQMVLEMYIEDIPKRIKDIFSHPQYIRHMITALPIYAQIMLLQGSILAKHKNLEKNKDTRKEILTYFDGFYGRVRNKWTIWYSHDTEQPTCLDEKKEEWVACNIEEKDMKKLDKKELLESPIGYIGLYNPNIDAFCIRDVSNERPTDLRKLTVGKRCKDWKVKELVEITNRMKLNPPSNFLKGATKQELLNEVNKIKQFANEDLTHKNSIELKRIIFFSRSRDVTCTEMKKWFLKNNLVKEDLDCGQQVKKRFRVI